MEVPVPLLPWHWGFESKLLNSRKKSYRTWRKGLIEIFSRRFFLYFGLKSLSFDPIKGYRFDKRKLLLFFSLLPDGNMEGVRSWKWLANGGFFPNKSGLMQFTCRHSSYDKMYNANLDLTCFQIRLIGRTEWTFFDRIWRHLSSETKVRLSRCHVLIQARHSTTSTG